MQTNLFYHKIISCFLGCSQINAFFLNSTITMEMAVKITFNAISANNNCPHNRKSRMQLKQYNNKVLLKCF